MCHIYSIGIIKFCHLNNFQPKNLNGMLEIAWEQEWWQRKNVQIFAEVKVQGIITATENTEFAIQSMEIIRNKEITLPLPQLCHAPIRNFSTLLHCIMKWAEHVYIHICTLYNS
jgi:hypothetical protein